MESHAAGSAKLHRTSSMDSEPKTLTKQQYDLARAAAALHAFEQRNNEATGKSRPEANPIAISSLMKDHHVGAKRLKSTKYPA